MKSVCLEDELGVLKLPVYKIENGVKSKVLRDVVVEYPLELTLNGKSVTTFLCTQENLKELVIGYAKTKGYINSLDDIESIEIDEENNIAKLKTIENKCDEMNEKIHEYLNDEISLNYKEIHNMMKRNLTYSKTFKHTGGVHSISIFDKEKEVVICEDVARHNAMDKAIGFCIINNICLKDKAIVLSGRVSVEMMLKAKLNQIPVVISKSAPTNLSIDMAQNSNITLVGFVRNNSLNIYTHPHRINEML